MKVGILLFLILCIWIGLGVLSAATVQAELISIGIEAVVDDVQDPDNYLEGRVNVGDLIRGTYTYDTDTPDMDWLWGSESDVVARYHYFNPPYGISLSAGGFDFMTDPADTNFLVEIGNNASHDDFYIAVSYNNLPLSSGTSINNIRFVLGDPSETALSSTELPTTAPVLDEWQVNFLNIGGGPGNRVGFVFLGHVTSAVLVPEPGTLAILAVGGLMFVRRNKKIR